MIVFVISIFALLYYRDRKKKIRFIYPIIMMIFLLIKWLMIPIENNYILVGERKNIFENIIFMNDILLLFIILFFIPCIITYKNLNNINKKKTKIIMSVSFSIIGIILNVILIKLALKIADIILNNKTISDSARLLPIIMVFGWSFVFLYLLIPIMSKFVCNKLFKFNYRKEDKNEENI